MNANECLWAVVNGDNETVKVFSKEEASTPIEAISEARNYILDSIIEAKMNNPEMEPSVEKAPRVIYAPSDGNGGIRVEDALEEIEL